MSFQNFANNYKFTKMYPLYLFEFRSDHAREFDHKEFTKFSNDFGIPHNFSATRTPQQNDVVERKNRTLEDMARPMLCESNLPTSFWAKAMNTTNYVLNRCLIHPILEKTPDELFKSKKSNISYFRAFGCKCFIHSNGKDRLGKFDTRSYEGISC